MTKAPPSLIEIEDEFAEASRRHVQDHDAATRLVERLIEQAREEGLCSSIPPEVRDAWNKISSHICHDGKMDDYRFLVDDFFRGRLS